MMQKPKIIFKDVEENGAVNRSEDPPLHELLTKQVTSHIENSITGKLIGFTETGEPLVTSSADTSNKGIKARSCVPLDNSAINREVVLLFDEGNSKQPIVMGVIQPTQLKADPEWCDLDKQKSAPKEVEIDGERLVFSAEKEIVLRCGKATITLTRAGKILIRGAYLLNRSSGVNLIKGGSVEIN